MSDQEEIKEGQLLREHSSEELKPENLLNYSQNIRRQVADSMTQGGIPNDDDTLKLLLGTLRDMDHTSIQSQKVDVDRDGVENDRAAQEIVRELSKVRPYGLRAEPGQETGEIPVPDIRDIPSKSFSEEEKEQGLSNLTAKDFLADMDDDSVDE